MRLYTWAFPKGTFVTLGAQGKVNTGDGIGSGPENLGFRGHCPGAITLRSHLMNFVVLTLARS